MDRIGLILKESDLFIKENDGEKAENSRKFIEK